LLTLLCLLPALLSQPLSPSLQLGIFVVLMLLTGLPHGATDHLVFRRLQPNLSARSFWLRFLLQYLGMIAAYAALWYFLPGISLLLFLLLTFFHFGQSEFFFIRLPESHPYKWALYLSWGALVILSILHFNLNESLPILTEILPPHGPAIMWWLNHGHQLLLVLLASSLLLLGLGVALNYLSLRAAWQELLIMAVLGVLFWSSGLLLSFAIYFGLWHATKAIYAELQVLRHKQSLSIGNFARQALPFTLLSLIGIGILIGLALGLEESFSPFLLFFIAISVLTLPHMSLMAGLYKLYR
jgi:Brp/Blh family beta-carotene 15,15'-monooxygenase